MTQQTKGDLQKLLNRAAFVIETVAHLRHLERELLPLAEELRLEASKQDTKHV